MKVATDGSPSDWVGDYEVIEQVRSGGMATLFLARRHGAAGFKRRAAIKVIHPHLSFDERFVRMFVDEARICSQISHPNVVHVEEFGEDRGLHYLVMEYIDGCSASQMLRFLRNHNRKMSPAMASRIVMLVAGGLHGAHETRGEDGQPLNIVHRDVSASNVLVSKDGHVKIIDFGIALARGRLAATATDYALKGKLRYMSPEQAMRRDVDRRSDVYSLGVVFWELLAGRALHEETDEIALLQRLKEGVVEPPSERNPDVPRELDDLVLRMLANDPAHRPQTAWQVRRSIVDVMPGALQIETNELGGLAAEVSAAAAQRKKERAALYPEYSVPDAVSYTTLRGRSFLGTGLGRRGAEDYELYEQIETKLGFWHRAGGAVMKHRLFVGAVGLLAVGLIGGRLLFGGGDSPTSADAPATTPAETSVAEPPATADSTADSAADSTAPAAAKPPAPPIEDTGDDVLATEATMTTDEPPAVADRQGASPGSRRRSRRQASPRRDPGAARARSDTDDAWAESATTTSSRGVRVGKTLVADNPFDFGDNASGGTESGAQNKVEKVDDSPIAADFDD